MSNNNNAERLAVIRAHLIASGEINNEHNNIAWLSHRVNRLEGQLATASEELERQRWYGEQLQMSIEGCSGNHHEIEEYPGASAALGLDGGDSEAETRTTAPDTAMDEFEAADDLSRRWE